ncbi:MAG: hypothetical protein RR557_07080 [Bacilli bacterium]
MKMTTEVIVFQCDHYDMGENRGVSVRIVGSKEETNNKFGLSVSKAKIPNYHELEYLKRFKDELPAKFKANLELTTVKLTNGSEGTGVSLSELQFVEAMEFVPKKVAVK